MDQNRPSGQDVYHSSQYLYWFCSNAPINAVGFRRTEAVYVVLCVAQPVKDEFAGFVWCHHCAIYIKNATLHSRVKEVSHL